MHDNLLKPLIDSLWSTGKLTYKLITKSKNKTNDDFKILFKNIGLCNKSNEYPKLLYYNEEKYFKTYLFQCPIGVTITDFNKKIEKLAHFLGVYEDSIRIERKNYNIEVKIITGRPNGGYTLDMKRKDFKVPLGYNLNDNKVIYWDFTKPNNAHCYIAGSSGGGKSVMIRSILSHLINSKSKRDIELSIINTKRVDLKDFKNVKHTVNYMTGTEGVGDFLENEIEEMERRYKLIEKYDCDDLIDFRSKQYKIPFRLIVIEEISSYKGNKQFMRSLELLASQGRGAGMLLLLVTQLPSYEIMPNTIKCNINTTIGLKTKDQIRAEIIAGPDSGLEKLKGNGHAKLFDGHHDGIEFQGLYIDEMLMKDIIKGATTAATVITPDNKNAVSK